MERKRLGKELDAKVAQKSYDYVIELIRIDFDSLENKLNSAIIENRKIFIGSGVNNPESKLNDHMQTLNVKPYFGWDDKCYPRFTKKRIYSN